MAKQFLWLDRVKIEVKTENPAAVLEKAEKLGCRFSTVKATPDGFSAATGGRTIAKMQQMGNVKGINLTGRFGSGILLEKLLSRPGIPLGLLCCLLLIRFFSGLLLFIDFGDLQPEQIADVRSELLQYNIVEGNRISQQQILAAQTALASRSDEFAWLSLNFINGRLEIEQTATQTQPTDTEPSAAAYYASENGKILSVELNSGFSRVLVGQYVAAGEQIASCERSGHAEGVMVYQKVSGKMMAEVTKKYTAVCSLSQQASLLTGRKSEESTLYLFGHLFPLEGNREKPSQYQEKESWLPLEFGGVALPGVIVQKSYWETEETEVCYSPLMAKQLALRSCRLQLMQEHPDYTLISEKTEILQDETSITAQCEYCFTANIAIEEQ